MGPDFQVLSHVSMLYPTFQRLSLNCLQFQVSLLLENLFSHGNETYYWESLERETLQHPGCCSRAPKIVFKYPKSGEPKSHQPLQLACCGIPFLQLHHLKFLTICLQDSSIGLPGNLLLNQLVGAKLVLVPYEGYFKGLKPRMERMAEKLRHVHKICCHFISRVHPGTFEGEGSKYTNVY